MKTLKSLAVAAAAVVATASMTTAANAQYRQCKDTEATIAGGVIGGSLGTIIGEEIAGRGNKTEGAILGGIIGGIAGAAVGDSASSCEKDGRIYDRRRDGRYYPRAYPTSRTNSYGYGHQGGYTTVRHPGRGHAHGKYKHRDRGYGHDRGYDRRDRELRRIDRYIEDLRRERRQLKDRARYEGYRPWIDRRLREIAYDLDRAKADRKRIKKADYYGTYRRDGYRTTRRGHYHGSNICYSDH